MPRPDLRASAGDPRRTRRPPTSTSPSSGPRKPLAIPSSVDFPDPFSPTSACTSPAQQSTLTSRSACTAPNAFDTPRRDNTRGLAGPGLDILLFAQNLVLTGLPPMGTSDAAARAGRVTSPRLPAGSP